MKKKTLKNILLIMKIEVILTYVKRYYYQFFFPIPILVLPDIEMEENNHSNFTILIPEYIQDLEIIAIIPIELELLKSFLLN